MIAGQVIGKRPSRRSVLVENDHGINTYNSHPGYGLTADMLLSYYRQAERGQPLRQFDCFDDIVEVDAHLRGLINGRIETVSGCNWVLAAGRPDVPSQIAASALAERLRNHLGFREFIEHHLTAPAWGIAISEIVWELEEAIVSPIDFTNAPARRFASPSEERADEILLVASVDGRKLLPLKWGQWAISRYRHRNPWAAGLLRTASWWAMFKRWSVRDWQVFAEMFGLPLAIGYYEEGAGEASRIALEDAVKSVGEDGYAILSAMTELVIKDTARSGDSSTVFPQITRLCEEQMSKLIAGATLTTSGGSGPGSYALGSVHADREYRLARADAKRIEEMFVRDIATPFVRWNGYDRAAPPVLNIQISNATKERAEVLQIIGQVIDLDEDQIREDFAIRKPAAGSGVKFPTKTAEKTPAEKDQSKKPPLGGKQ